MAALELVPVLMHLDVRGHALTLDVGLAANRTSCWHRRLFSVDQQLGFVVGRLRQSIARRIVAFLVVAQAGIGAERAGANLTDVRSFPGVDAHVLFECGQSVEAARTLRAFIFVLVYMGVHVHVQTFQVGFAADRTGGVGCGRHVIVDHMVKHLASEHQI